MNDQDLIDLTLQGTVQAFGQLVSRYQDRLFRSLLAVSGSPEDAEDVAQDTFVLAYQKLATFHGESQFYTWIYRIALNLWISHRRRKPHAMPAQSLHASPALEPTSVDTGPDQDLLRAENVSQVHAALARLSEEHRTILALRELDGCDYDTIAEVLELPIGTVRSRLHRARLLLKQELEQILGT